MFYVRLSKSCFGWLGFAAGISLFLILCPGFESAAADEMVYKPINPNFGGNPFNGSYLLGNASEQRGFSPPKDKKKPAVEEFSDEIQRALMYRISRDVADMILGEDAKESGHFSVGDTTVDFHREGDQVIINVLDDRTGGETTIELPMPQY